MEEVGRGGKIKKGQESTKPVSKFRDAITMREVWKAALQGCEELNIMERGKEIRK